VAGLPALEQGIRGPTLSAYNAADHASNAIVAVINYWIRYSRIVSVIAIAHYKKDEGRHLFKGLIAKSAGDEIKDNRSCSFVIHKRKQ